MGCASGRTDTRWFTGTKPVVPCTVTETGEIRSLTREASQRFRHKCVSATRSGLSSVPNHFNAWWKQGRFNLNPSEAQTGLEIKFEPLMGDPIEIHLRRGLTRRVTQQRCPA